LIVLGCTAIHLLHDWHNSASPPLLLPGFDQNL
jgi:hypothetical protein